MVHFTLKTTNEKELKTMKKVVRQLQTKFGRFNVKVEDYDTWVTIEMAHAFARVQTDNKEYQQVGKMHIWNDDCRNGFDIPLDNIDMIYCL